MPSRSEGIETQQVCGSLPVLAPAVYTCLPVRREWKLHLLTRHFRTLFGVYTCLPVRRELKLDIEVEWKEEYDVYTCLPVRRELKLIVGIIAMVVAAGSLHVPSRSEGIETNSVTQKSRLQ